jgi:hypothetical protein
LLTCGKSSAAVQHFFMNPRRRCRYANL